MPILQFTGEGVRIADVSNSPAAMQIAKGDVIISFDGKTVKNLKDYPTIKEQTSDTGEAFHRQKW